MVANLHFYLETFGKLLETSTSTLRRDCVTAKTGDGLLRRLEAYSIASARTLVPALLAAEREELASCFVPYLFLGANCASSIQIKY